MKAIIFNGALEKRTPSTSGMLSQYFSNELSEKGIENEIFNLADAGIPLFDITLTNTPRGVELMSTKFLEADVHFWLAPLYHGSIPGVMKNCLDWLEITSGNHQPYLTDKIIGLVCWADGLQAMNGINTMESIAKSLRAWPIPYSVPVVKSSLFDNEKSSEFSSFYTNKFNKLIHIATSKKIENYNGN